MKTPFLILLLFILPVLLPAQEIVFSEPIREDIREMNFDILGRMNGNILVFKNVRFKYALNIYDDSMQLKKKVELDFLPHKTFNVDYVVYPDFFYLIYQYQKKGTLYCMALKMDGNGKKINEPVQLDTTQVGVLGDNKIYSTINSEDKKRIAIFKIQNKDDKANFLIKLYDNELQLLHQTRQSMDYDQRKDAFSEFFVDNEGNFVFANSIKINNRDNPSGLNLIRKALKEDSFKVRKLAITDVFIDEIKLKVDNVNKRYIINTFYYKTRNGNIDGIYCHIWDAKDDSSYANIFTEFNEELKSTAKSSGSSKGAFNNYYIRNVILKKDGSFVLMAEDYSSQTTGSDYFNRYDYLYGNPYVNPYSYYYYSPYGYYRPYGSLGRQGTRFYYDNVLIVSLSKKGIPEWTNLIHKQQFSDDNDNYLSFNTFNTAGEIHVLYNDISKRNKLLSDNIITPDGTSRRTPTVRTYENGYEFMPRFAKQIGSRQVIIPCIYRGLICFAKADF
jgi:hypothetical protein